MTNIFCMTRAVALNLLCFDCERCRE